VLAGEFVSELQRNLDFEIANQDPDGSWGPSWSWKDRFPEAWAIAEREWRGVLTLETLISLRAYSRIEEASLVTSP
jgi:hypothetical protein